MVRWQFLFMILRSGELASHELPNIVFILVDNTGWGDFGVYGGRTATPHIDSLAADGVRFNNYTVESQCTPTRSAILTGRQPIRMGTFAVPLPGQGEYGMSPWEYTLAELLCESGYSTAAFGKWHLGEVEGRLPTDQGFDQWWGIKNTTDEAGYSSYALYRAVAEATGIESPQIWEGTKEDGISPVCDFDMSVRPLMDEMITDRTCNYISDHASGDAPFFTYVAMTHVHPPEQSHPDFDQTSPERTGMYADVIAEMDHRVGQILEAIEDSGAADDTIVVFSSDNGTGGIEAVPGGSSGPWRGNFFTPPFEGSMRVPAIIRWPERIQAGVVTQEMMAAYDWLPTFAGLIGRTDLVPTDRPIDGIDTSKFLLGDDDGTGRTTVLFYGPDGELMSAKWHDIKVVFRYSLGIDQPIVTPQLPMVYDLKSDPGEEVNLLARKLDMGWMYAPALHHIADFQQSMAEFPNIAPGADFDGYDN
jgi:arylsulfatase A-like enzyme